MHAWPVPSVPVLDSTFGPVPELRLYDTADDTVKPVKASSLPPADHTGTNARDTAREDAMPAVGIYVCGITPYDSTHLGHAATYLTFDLINRYFTTSGRAVHFVQNITDVDDPLFERAERDGVNWRELGTGQIDLFRSDMTDLQVIPPQHYIGAIEAVPEVVDMVQQLLDVGAAYQLSDDEYPDVYADHTFTSQFGYESRYDEQTMNTFFAERGGDPERAGKRHPLDGLLWRAHRPGEPAWPAPFGEGRPGWHIECSAIAVNRLGYSFDIQGGGSDLRFPHHEYSAAHAEAAHGVERMAGHYVHTGMIGLEGTKMSKSLGNLVFVSKLTAAGHDPSAIRLGVYSAHYRSDRDWSDEVLAEAERRLATWREAFTALHESGLVDFEGGNTGADEIVQRVRAHIADDLNTPAVLATVDEWAADVLATTGEQSGVSAGELSDSATQAAAKTAEAPTSARGLAEAIGALLGIDLSSHLR